MRYKIILSYDGSSFCGWQVQNGAPTVQECLQKALTVLLKEEISVTGAGRTDSKVNAVNYTAHFDSSVQDLDASALGYKINAILPHGIRVHGIVPAAPGFHARFDARMREYKYFVHRKKDPFMDSYSLLWTFPVDIGRMNLAARSLLGRHDFSSFEKTGSDNRTSICEVSMALDTRLADGLPGRRRRLPRVHHPGRPLPQEHGPCSRRNPARDRQGKARSGMDRGPCQWRNPL